MDESVRIRGLITDEIEKLFNQQEEGELKFKAKRVARGVVILEQAGIPSIMVRVTQLTER